MSKGRQNETRPELDSNAKIRARLANSPKPKFDPYPNNWDMVPVHISPEKELREYYATLRPRTAAEEEKMRVYKAAYGAPPVKQRHTEHRQAGDANSSLKVEKERSRSFNDVKKESVFQKVYEAMREDKLDVDRNTTEQSRSIIKRTGWKAPNAPDASRNASIKHRADDSITVKSKEVSGKALKVPSASAAVHGDTKKTDSDKSSAEEKKVESGKSVSETIEQAVAKAAEKYMSANGTPNYTKPTASAAAKSINSEKQTKKAKPYSPNAYIAASAVDPVPQLMPDWNVPLRAPFSLHQIFSWHTAGDALPDGDRVEAEYQKLILVAGRLFFFLGRVSPAIVGLEGHKGISVRSGIFLWMSESSLAEIKFWLNYRIILEFPVQKDTSKSPTKINIQIVPVKDSKRSNMKMAHSSKFPSDYLLEKTLLCESRLLHQDAVGRIQIDVTSIFKASRKQQKKSLFLWLRAENHKQSVELLWPRLVYRKPQGLEGHEGPAF